MKLFTTGGIITASIAIIVILLGAAIWQNVKPSKLNEFAQCLSDKGVTMYGAWWCPHCQEQRSLFGTAFKNIKHVECGGARGQINAAICPDITATPTWKDQEGGVYTGTQQLKTLSERYSCPLPEGYE